MYRVFNIARLFDGPYSHFFKKIVSFTVSPVGSPLFLQFSVTGARGGAGLGAHGLVACRAGSQVF